MCTKKTILFYPNVNILLIFFHLVTYLRAYSISLHEELPHSFLGLHGIPSRMHYNLMWPPLMNI